ncbi:MAG: hypothetical protein ACPGJW_09920 [Paracoccaceae bacterium]
MALKSKVEDISELPEGLAEFYTQAEGGGYELAVEGMVPKKSLDEFRDTNIKLQKDLAKLSKTFSNVDLEEYKSLKQREQAEKDQELISAGKVDELVLQRTERLRSDLESQMKQFEEQAKDSAARAARAEQERDSYLINTRLQQAAATAGVRDTAVPDVLNRAQAVWRIDPESKDLMPMQGDQVVYGRKGTGPMSMDEWFGSLEEQAPHLFKSSSGGGASGGVGVSGRKVSIYDQRSLNNSLEAIAAGKVQITE